MLYVGGKGDTTAGRPELTHEAGAARSRQGSAHEARQGAPRNRRCPQTYGMVYTVWERKQRQTRSDSRMCMHIWVVFLCMRASCPVSCYTLPSHRLAAPRAAPTAADRRRAQASTKLALTPTSSCATGGSEWFVGPLVRELFDCRCSMPGPPARAYRRCHPVRCCFQVYPPDRHLSYNGYLWEVRSGPALTLGSLPPARIQLRVLHIFSPAQFATNHCKHAFEQGSSQPPFRSLRSACARLAVLPFPD